jgi:hypothetical protein
MPLAVDTKFGPLAFTGTAFTLDTLVCSNAKHKRTTFMIFLRGFVCMFGRVFGW